MKVEEYWRYKGTKFCERMYTVIYVCFEVRNRSTSFLE
eukprot:COSAG01_NODE_1683_length_9497_cov_33.408172_9_plen_38_part_00